MINFLSVCSGIEAASVAWEPLGWRSAGYAEIDPFASRVLHHHYSSGRPRNMPACDAPGLKLKERNARRAAIKAVSRLPERANGVTNWGDFTAINLALVPMVRLLVGGTPCQAFSIAGKRLSLADARGNLSLAFTVLAHELARSHGLAWAVWENVPGVLSTPDNAFGCFLGGLVGADDAIPLPRGAERWPDAGMVAGPRARAAWRILDAQYFGLAQRRRRVFVVAGFEPGTDPAAVLFEQHGLHRHPPSRRQAGEDVAGDAGNSAPGGSRHNSHWNGGIHPPLSQSSQTRGGGIGASNQELFEQGGAGLVPTAACQNGIGEYGADLPTLRAKGGDAGGGSEALLAFGGNNTSGPIDVATAVRAHGGPCGHIDFESETFVTHALRTDGFDASEDGTGRGTPIVPIAFDCKAGGDTSFSIGDIPGALRGVGHGGGHSAVATAYAVRRLMPCETEVLQGFSGSYTDIPGASDGPRYKTHGNSMAVPVMAWIGRRIDAQERALRAVRQEAAE